MAVWPVSWTKNTAEIGKKENHEMLTVLLNENPPFFRPLEGRTWVVRIVIRAKTRGDITEWGMSFFFFLLKKWKGTRQDRHNNYNTTLVRVSPTPTGARTLASLIHERDWRESGLGGEYWYNGWAGRGLVGVVYNSCPYYNRGLFLLFLTTFAFPFPPILSFFPPSPLSLT